MNLDVVNVSDRVAESLTRYSMLKPGDRVGVGVSGGADSVVLLHVLHEFGRYDLVVLHANHMLRQEESDADERFVRELAHQLQLAIEVNAAPIAPGNLEQQARDARKAFFAGAQARLNLARVALGHNQTDQAETVLYRFLRGSGTAGLAGMRPVNGDVIRPLLSTTREEIRAWALARGLRWREDSTNQSSEFVRNRLRLEFVNSRMVPVIAATAQVSQDEEDWWAERITSSYKDLVQASRWGDQFPVAGLSALHPAEQRRVLRHAIRCVKGDLRSIDLPHVEALRALLRTEAGHDRVQVPGVDALRSFGTLLFARPGSLAQPPRHFHLGIELGVDLALPYGGGHLYVDQVTPNSLAYGNFGGEGRIGREFALLDRRALLQSADPLSLQLRNWEPGDEYCRAGQEKPEKIKSLFQEYRVPLWERKHWPVLVSGDRIVWSRQFGAAAEFQATAPSHDVVRLVYTRSS